MKSEQKRRIGKLGEVVLLTVGTVGIISIALVAPNALQLFSPLLKKRKKNRLNQDMKRNVESLIQGGFLIQRINRSGEFTLELTPKGRYEAALRHNALDKQQTDKWDGWWRIIIFDIPNKNSELRNELRRAVRMYGFYMVQKSVWVYPYPCDNFVVLVKSHLGISNDVLFVVASSMENDKELKRAFKLQK